MLIVMTALDAYATNDKKTFSRIALVFMIIKAAITSSVHFVILSFSQQGKVLNFTWMPLFFAFKWPSVV